MTSPAIGQQKDKNEGSSSDENSSQQQNCAAEAEEFPQATPALTAWWRVFKLASLLMKQGC